jgi:hypothetical protein
MNSPLKQNDLKTLRERDIRETEDFINANWSNPDLAWTTEWTLPTVQPEPAATPDSLDGLTVYAQGVFYLDRSVYIDATLLDFLASLRTNQEKLRFRWAFNGCEVGGFPAQAIRNARAKRASVAVGSILPTRVPPANAQAPLRGRPPPADGGQGRLQTTRRPRWGWSVAETGPERTGTW